MAEGKWVRGNWWPVTDQYKLKDKQTYFIEDRSWNMCTITYCTCMLALGFIQYTHMQGFGAVII